MGTPKGVIVFIAHGEVSTDLINGTVSYGGVAMTREVTAADTVSEPGRSYAYTLGAGIPTGAQTVSISHTGSANVKACACVTQTAARDTEIVASDILEENSIDPQITLSSGSTESLIYMATYSGLFGPTGLHLLSGETAIVSDDFGAFCWRTDRETSPATGVRTVGYTGDGTPDDTGMVAVAVAEVATSSGQAPRSMHQFRQRRVA